MIQWGHVLGLDQLNLVINDNMVMAAQHKIKKSLFTIIMALIKS